MVNMTMYTKVNHAEYNGLVRKLIGWPKRKTTSVLVQRGRNTFRTREPRPGDVIYMPVSYKKIFTYLTLGVLILIWRTIYDMKVISEVISYFS